MVRTYLLVIVMLAGVVACRSEMTSLNLERLQVPAGFHVTVFAQGKHPRLLAFSPGGVLLATDTEEGQVLAYPDPSHSGRAQRQVVVLQDLNAPHGIAFYGGQLYIAETHQVVRYDWDEPNLRASGPRVLAQLPRGGMHFTRTLVFNRGKLYVSIGSDCNVCQEKDERRATVLELNPDGSGQRIFARGLRNAVGLAVNPRTNTVWTGENGRDWLGDNLPPDEINDLRAYGGDFGWPACYGNRVVDPANEKQGLARCPSTIPARVELQAHSAPLGIAFYTGTMFPPEYRGDLFVALHGSWNRLVPTGYKVIRIHMDEAGEPQGHYQEFIAGWLAPNETRRGVWIGRPVGLAVAPDGALFISDDANGSLYRVTWQK